METPTVTRMAPGEARAEDALQGWAMSSTEPSTGAAGGSARPFDLLFVHGMAAGGWMWDGKWLDRFAEAGYRSWTVTLPGRQGGATLATDPAALDRALALAFNQGDVDAALAVLARAVPGMSALDGPGLGDFSDAIEDSIDNIGRPVALICHSLGGAAAQNLLRRGARPAATVLMGSVPPYGLWRASLEMAFTNPDLYMALADFAMAGLGPHNIRIMRQNLFPGGISDQAFDEIAGQLTDESLRAMTQALGFPPFAPFPGLRDDLLVIGGALDRFVPVPDVLATALYYGTMAQIIPESGHMMMVDKGADRTANTILGFLEKRAAAFAA